MIAEATDADFAALLMGHAPYDLNMPEGPFESLEILNMLRELACSIRPTFTPACWLIVNDSEIVGLCSLVKSPSNATIDIGYGIATSRRRRGLASRAVASVLEWARSEPRVALVRAETSIENLASQQVLERNGFKQMGTRIDSEDGPVNIWHVDVG